MTARYQLVPCSDPGCSLRHGVVPTSRSTQYEPAAGESADGAALTEAPARRLTAGPPRPALGSKAAGAVIPGPRPQDVARALRPAGSFTRRRPRLAAADTPSLGRG